MVDSTQENNTTEQLNVLARLRQWQGNTATMSYPPPFEGEEVIVTMTEIEWSGAGLRVAVTALMLASCTPFAASAQEDSAALETLVVTGTRIPDRSNSLLASTVLNTDTIEARNDSNVLELLSPSYLFLITDR